MTVHLPEHRWVHRLDLNCWDKAPESLIDIDLIVPTQVVLHLEAYLKVVQMLSRAVVPKDPVLLVHHQGLYLIRDGHHRYAALMGKGSDFMAGKVYKHA